MLRTGEFPNAAYGLCEKSYNMKVGSLDGGGSSNSSSSGSKSSSSDGSDSKNKEGSSEKKGSKKSSSDNGDSGANFRSSGSKQPASIDQGTPFDSNGRSDVKKVKINGGNSGEEGSFELGAGFNDSSGSTVIVRRIRRGNDRIGGSFLISGDEAQNTQEESGSTKVSTAPLPSGMRESKPRVASFVIPKTSNKIQKESSDKGFDFSFMNIVKWTIIIAILVFFLIFTGNQLNSIRKGWTDE